MCETLPQDLRYALRSLRRTPGFTAAVLVTLAIGIGATAAIFTIVNAALLKPLPYPDRDRLFVLTLRQGGSSESGQVFLHVRERVRLFDHVAAQGFATGWNVSTPDSSLYVTGLRVSEGFFDLHGISPLAGRGFSPAEDQPNGPDVAVLSETLWRRLFDGRIQALGETIQLGGVAHTVVGIMPDGFRTIPGADVWTPLRTTLADSGVNYRVLARLRPGVSYAQAAAELDGMRSGLQAEFPRIPEQRLANLTWVPYRDLLGRGVRQRLLVLLGAVAFLLLIACANVASLHTARAIARRREVALRAALGATRGRLLQPLVAESLLLAVAGAVAGLAVAAAGTRLLLSLVSPDLARDLLSGEVASLDWRVLLVTMAIALSAGLFFGVAPAFVLSRFDVRASLSAGARATPGRRTAWFRRSLAVSEMALAAVLLVGAGLLLRTFVNLSTVDLGFDPAGVVVGRMSLQGDATEDRARREALFDQTLARLRQIPGVGAAAAANNVPVETGLNVALLPPDDGLVDEPRPVDWRYITPGYFSVFQVPMRGGRTFDEQDTAAGRPVAIVNESFARTYFGRTDVVGQTIQLVPAHLDPPREIVGIVADVKARSNTGWTRGPNALGSATAPAMYVPAAQAPEAVVQSAHRFFAMTWSVRTDGTNALLERDMQDAVRAVDATLPFFRFERMTQVVAQDLDMQRLMTVLLVAFASIAMLLAAVGLYGLIAYSASQRAREVGVRMALGATSARVVRAFMTEGLVLIIAGLALGTAGSVLLSQLLAAQLYDVTPLDAPTFAVAAAMLAAVAAVATLVPAARAARINPVEALRAD